jgi:molybdate transport system substrate-binding protein
LIDYQPILGNNVGQAFQFAISGNVSAALIAYSQILDWRHLHPGDIPPGEIWLVPAERYEPILQQAIMVRKDAPHPAAARFMQYLQSAEGRGIMADHGYRLLPQS